MAGTNMDSVRFSWQAASGDNWPDLERLFGPRGACAGCWCMFWRVPRAQFNQQSGEANHAAFHAVIERGATAGILAYAEDQPVGWCAIAPRETYPGLGRSRILKPVDDEPVWSITCFFTARKFRRKGLMAFMIQAAVEYARSHGAKIVEGYPIQPKKDDFPDVYAYTGIFSAFQAAGFVEVLRRSETRPIMRFYC